MKPWPLNFDTLVLRQGLDYDATGLIEANAGRQAAEAWRGRIFDANAKETTRSYGEGEEGGVVSGPPVFDRERGKEPGRGEAARASPAREEGIVTAPTPLRLSVASRFRRALQAALEKPWELPTIIPSLSLAKGIAAKRQSHYRTSKGLALLWRERRTILAERDFVLFCSSE